MFISSNLVNRIPRCKQKTREWLTQPFKTNLSFLAVREARLTKLSLTIILAFLLCWTPYLVTRLLVLMSIDAPAIVQTCAVWVLHLHSVTNPIVYTCYRTGFRKAITDLLVKRPANPGLSSLTTSQMVMAERHHGLAIAPVDAN